jgi:hypothetical protein
VGRGKRTKEIEYSWSKSNRDFAFLLRNPWLDVECAGIEVFSYPFFVSLTDVVRNIEVALRPIFHFSQQLMFEFLLFPVNI